MGGFRTRGEKEKEKVTENWTIFFLIKITFLFLNLK